MANDDRDTDSEEDEKVAEDHLAQQRRPVKSQEGAHTAKGKGRHDTDGNGEAGGNDLHAFV